MSRIFLAKINALRKNFSFDRLRAKGVFDHLVKLTLKGLINMSKRVDSLSGQVEKQEQYSRRSCLLLHDIPENQNEKTDDWSIATIIE